MLHAREQGRRNARLHENTFRLIALFFDRASLFDKSENRLFPVGNEQLHADGLCDGAQRLGDSLAQVRKSLSRSCRYEDGIGGKTQFSGGDFRDQIWCEQVDLVQDSDRGKPVGAQLAQHAADRDSLLRSFRMRDVDDMQEQVGIEDLLECRPERCDQGGRQFVDEADRIGEERDLAVWQFETSGRRVECREQFVFCENGRTGQGVQECRLPRIRIAHERNHWQPLLPASLPVSFAMTTNVFELTSDPRDPFACPASIDLQLGLAWPAQSDSTHGLARKVRPHASEAWQPVLELG